MLSRKAEINLVEFGQVNITLIGDPLYHRMGDLDHGRIDFSCPQIDTGGFFMSTSSFCVFPLS